MNDTLVIVFCKNSLIGKVKTRLAKSIGGLNALKIHDLLVSKTISVLKQIENDVVVFHSDFIPNDNKWSFTKFQKIQNGKDLGVRMKKAFEWGFEVGYQKICIIGTDLWTVEKKIFRETFIALKKIDIVFGPAKDGGYYLLGLKKINYSIFNLNSWGTSKVLDDTVKKIDNTETVCYLQELNDIDTEEDLNLHNDLKSLI
tara:strand:- start:1506 stop:2105 length:600 start_codon:yes stop_codon:yes gene_type:complete